MEGEWSRMGRVIIEWCGNVNSIFLSKRCYPYKLLAALCGGFVAVTAV